MTDPRAAGQPESPSANRVSRPRFHLLVRIQRKFRLSYLRLMRTPDAEHVVARGAALGTFLEFITFPTLGLALLFVYPVVKLARGSVAAAMLLYLMWKSILWIFIPLNIKFGHYLMKADQTIAPTVKVPLSGWDSKVAFVKEQGAALFIGSAASGIIASVIVYFFALWAVRSYRERRARHYLKSGSA